MGKEMEGYRPPMGAEQPIPLQEFLAQDPPKSLRPIPLEAFLAQDPPERVKPNLREGAVIFIGQPMQRHPERQILSYEESKQYIEDKLEQAKNSFLLENTGDGSLAYVQGFDDARYRTLYGLRGSVDQRAFIEALSSVNSETDFNIATLLGEIWNARLSKCKYRIVNGHLVSEYSDKPFIETIARGQEYREKKGSPWVRREKAEVTGFRQIDNDLSNPKTPSGTMWFYPSPPEGAYMHNFGDVFVKNGVDVELYRLSLTASNQEYAEFLAKRDPRLKAMKNPDASFFLANPFKISPNDPLMPTPEAIQKLFSKDVNGMSWEEYQQGLKEFSSLREGYIERCNPSHPEYMERMNYFHTLVLLAAKYKDRFAENTTVDASFYSGMSSRGISSADVAFFAMQAIPGMDLNCGFLGGVGGALAAYGGPFGAAGAGAMGYFMTERMPKRCKDCGGTEGDNHYHCPDCNYRYEDETHKLVRTPLCINKPCEFAFGC